MKFLKQKDIIEVDQLIANVVDAINLSAENAIINSAKIQDLDASKIISGEINTDILKANVITAINISSEIASINSAKIEDLDASKIKSGYIETDRLVGNVIDAINLSAENAKINGAKILDATIGTAQIADATITNAKITDLDAGKITSGLINTEILKGNVVEAINLSADNAYINGAKILDASIDDAKISYLDASKITAGDIAVERLKGNVIDAINAYIGLARIEGAKIKDATIDTAQIADLAVTDAQIATLDANKIISGDIDVDRLKTNVINAINLSADIAYIDGAKIADATIEDAKIANLSASKIISGDIDVERLQANVINAINLTTSLAKIDGAKILDASIDNAQIKDLAVTNAKIKNLNADKIDSGTINANRISGTVIEAINLSTSEAKIDSAKIQDLSADKIISGDIDSERITANVINAINSNISEAQINSAKITDLDASKIISGNIDTDRLTANIISAINLSANDAYIDGAKINDGTITNAKIQNLDANKINAGSLNTTVMQTNVIDAINANISDATIKSSKIEDLDANKIKSGTIDAEIISGSVINAINSYIGNAQIESAKIADLDASKITTGIIDAKRLNSSVINAINISTETAVIESSKIANLDASKIVSGDISANRLKANIIEAINFNTSEATIDSAKIGYLDASKITSGIIDTSKVIISNSLTETGARLSFANNNFSVYNDANNVMISLGLDGFVTHVPGGIKIDNGGSLKIGSTEDIIIDDEGIKSKAGGMEYTGFFTGDGLIFKNPSNFNKQIIINSGEIKLTKDGGITASTAITPDGFYGQLLIDNTIPANKFDTIPPAIPTWREEGLVSELEQTAETQIVNIIVKWNEVFDDDLEGYKVYIDENNSGTFYPVAIVGKTNQYKIRGIKSNTNYKVKVTSFDVQGNECSTLTPLDNTLTTYAKTIITQKDIIAPKQPIETPIIINGLKSFTIKWNETILNEDDSECVDLAYYEVERYSSKDKNWVLLGNIKGTSLLDDNVEYDIEYKYRYRPVDLSGNKPDFSPEVIAGKPSQIGSADIVANSITSEHISVTGLDASIIKSGKISGDIIEAKTITADAFESTLHGDITQSVRYVESKLNVKIYEWVNSQDNYNAGIHNNTYSYNGILMLDTVNKWDDNLTWDDENIDWDIPVVATEGYWESPVLDIGKNMTMLNIPKFSYNGSKNSSVSVYAKHSEDNITWTEYSELIGEVLTCRYVQFKIILKVNSLYENIYVDTFYFQFFNDNSIEIDEHINNTDLTTHGSITDEIITVGGLNTNGLITLNETVKLKNNTDKLEIRNSNDTNYADLVVNNLTVKGTTTIIDSEIVTFNDNVLILNNNFIGSTPTENGGFEIERGALTNASLLWDESNDKWKIGLKGFEVGISLEGHTHTKSNITDFTHDHNVSDLTNGILGILRGGTNNTSYTTNNFLVYDGSKISSSSFNSSSFANAGHNHDSIYLGINANAVSASKLATARSISLTGDVSGSANFDGSGNISITSVVADDSHNHIISNIDGLQTALDGKLNLSGGTLTGGIIINGTVASQPLQTRGIVGSDGNGVVSDLYLQYNANSSIYLGNTGAYSISADGSNYSGNSATATKLQTARTISLVGDVTGSVSFDGSADVSITATVTNDSHAHSYVLVPDTRSDNFSPNSYGRELKSEFKYRNVIGNPGTTGTYCGLVTFAPWSHSSGGYVYQLAFTQDKNIYLRANGLGDASWTDSWKKLWHNGDFTSTNISNWNTAYTHISSTGADHSYINQSVTTSASPTFAGITTNGGIQMPNTNTKPNHLYINSDSYPAVYIDQYGAGDIVYFRTSGVDKVVIKNNGCVGIGTDAPSQKLHISGNSSSGYPILCLDNITGHRWHLWAIDGNDLRFKDDTNNADCMTIQGGTGNVGIGTTTPSEKLEVEGAISIKGKYKIEYNPTEDSLDFCYI